MIKLRKDASWFFAVGDLRMTKVRDWYMENFASDDLGASLKDDVTMWDVVAALNAGLGDRVYDLIGVGDSIVRERIFSRIAEMVGCDYCVVYSTWIGK